MLKLPCLKTDTEVMKRPSEHIRALKLWPRDPRGNVLKQFLAWLKLQAPRARFSYAHQGTTLLRNMSLLDNLLMAFEEGELAGTYLERERLLAQKFEVHNLKGLASWFQNPRRYYAELTPQERFIASVCHALLRPAEKTLIDMEGIELDPLCLKQLQQVLEEKAADRMIIIYGSDSAQWPAETSEEFSPLAVTPSVRSA